MIHNFLFLTCFVAVVVFELGLLVGVAVGAVDVIEFYETKKKRKELVKKQTVIKFLKMCKQNK